MQSRDTLADYRRVRFEEYASTVVFGLATVVFGYWTFEGMTNEQNTFSTLLSCYLAIGCCSLAESSFEQGRVMSREASRLERELRNSSRKI